MDQPVKLRATSTSVAFSLSDIHEFYLFDILLTRGDVSAVVTTTVWCRAGQKAQGC